MDAPLPAPSPMPPPAADAARLTQSERRARSEQNLLAAAASLIAAEGVSAATLERIGLRAGYSRGLATQKYGSKQGLIEALIAQLHLRLNTQLADAHLETQSGLEAALSFARTFLHELAEDEAVRAYFMLMASALADHAPARQAFAQSHAAVRLQLEALITRGQGDGSIDPALAAEDTATLIGSQLLGLATQHLIDPQTRPQNLAAQAAELIARQLAARG